MDKIGKPKILTESDRILTDLSQELAQLKDRMSQLETEQEESRHLIDQISFEEALANKTIQVQKQEITAHKENYQVIAGVMHDLKTPVNSVMQNLASIIQEIDDLETQESLKDCMNTASSVLEGFTEVEEFCLFESGDFLAKQKEINLRGFFTELVSNFQMDPALGRKHKLSLVVDSKVPDSLSAYTETLSFATRSLIEELAGLAASNKLTVQVKLEESTQAHGLELSDLVVELKIEGGTLLAADTSWVNFVRAHGSKLRQSGFSLLKTRDRARQTGGHLEMISGESHLEGFRLILPMTY
ncbi:MAG: hypothetical protein RRB13_01660 [bacterium]|nr:hypothetical protein [bacterium]